MSQNMISQNETMIYPLTSYQKEIWLEQSLYMDSPIYNTGGYYEILGKIDRQIFQKSIYMLIQETSTLRLRVIQKGEEYYQKVLPQIEYELPFYDFSKFENSKELCVEWMNKEFIKLFKYDSDLFQFALLKASEDHYFFFCRTHHVIIDGWGYALFFKTLVHHYNMLMEGISQWDSLPSYMEFIPEDQEYLKSKVYQKDIAFWRERYVELPEQLFNRKTNRQELPDCTFTSGRKILTIKRSLYNEMVEFSQEQGSSIFHFVLGVLFVYFSKMGNHDEMIIGVPILNRRKKEYKQMIGHFVNMIPLKISAGQDISFVELLNQIKSELRKCYRHQKLPSGEIYRTVFEKEKNKRNLFELSLSYEKHDDNESFKGTERKPVWISHQSERRALSLSLREFSGEQDVEINFDYLFEIFDEYMPIENVMSHFEYLFCEVIKKSQESICNIDIIPDSDKEKLLYDFNDTRAEYPREKTIQGLFEEQVERTPDNVAVVFQDKKLTYRQLNEKANKLSRVLRDKGVMPDSIVSIMTERSMDMIIAALAILKAGGAYLPIDPHYPVDRITYMLENSQTRILLTQKDLEDTIEFEGITLCIDDESLYTGDGANISRVNSPENLAYIIYTSGTTGKPKGVMIEHRNVVRLMFNDRMQFDFNEKDAWTMFHSFCFDFSVWEMYGALLYGGKLVIVPQLTAQDTGEYLKLLRREKVTVLNQTPTAFYHLAQQELKESGKELAIRYVIFGGEALKPAMLKGWNEKYPATRLINMYGITETTVHVTFKEITGYEIDANISNIGKPIPTLNTYIMDKNMRLLPVGMAGELCVGGEGVARGYLNNIELTAQKFVPNPYKPEERLYRSGDLARMLSNGEMEYLGRIDHQVKIRGFRIELGEIETKLIGHPSVKEALVLAREEEGDSKYLCAYVVAEQAITVEKLREYLSEELPDYMVPSYFVQLAKMPLTANGKIDRKALPEPDGSINTGVEYIAPIDEVEEKLVMLWQEILGVEKVGTKDNFFNLGGHSLRATRLVSEIHKGFNVEMPLREVFMGPTIAQIAQFIKGAEKNIYGAVQPVEQKEYYPMSSAQKRLYILNQLEGADITYNMAGAVIVEGSIDVIRLEEAFQKLIERHESLRTSFEMIDGQSVQKVNQKVDFHVEYMESIEGKVEEIVKEFVIPFDLSKAPLLRVALVKLDEQRHLLLLDMHHIISDGVSINILLREFAQLYEQKNLSELRIQYKDYAVWQRELFENGTINKQQDYWLDVFAGEIPVLDMPLDYQRPSVQQFEGSSVDFEIDRLLAEKLDKLAKEKGATLYMVLLAAYTTLLAKYTGQEDIIVGSPIAGRPHADLQDIIGMFVNTLAMRNYPGREKTFEVFLQEVKENAIKAYENQDYPFEELVDKLNLQRDMSRNPLFDTMFTMQNMTLEELKMQSLNFIPYKLENKISKFDISLDAFEGKEGMLFTLEYCTRLFTKETMERIAKHFINILEVIAENPSVKISEINMLSQEEKQQLVYDFNSNKAEFNRDLTVHHLFEEHAKKAPNDTAILFEGEKYSYGQINEKANRIANYLVKAGLQKEEPVAVLLDRSPLIVEGILGIWKAGGAYIPIDPDYPMQRIENVLEESKVRFILSLSEYASPELENAYDGQWICLDASEKEIEKESGENLELDIDTNGLAYVIYTSGSTGRPKGAMIEHLGMMNHIHAEIDELKITKTSLVAQNASHCFDVSVWQFFAALTIGARIAIYPNEVVVDVRQFTDRIIEDGVTVLEVVPSVLVVMIEHMKEQGKRAEELEYLLVTGETVKPDLIEKWFEISKETKVVNAYGPAEASDDVTQHTMTEVPKGESIPIGKPIQNISIYIVDQDMKLCPVGVKGEICVSGIGVGRGYLNNPEKTKEVFLEDPFIEEKGVRLYKTGDIGRWLEDGNIEFYGRKDYQVKIRGHRIELEEIETRILKHPKVKEAVVVDKAEATGEKTLCGYIVFEGDTKAGELREYLQEYLPGYMIPTYIVPIEKMPLSPNGKVDRKALPEPDEDMRTGVEYVAPRDETEEKLAALWQEILGVERVGINDNFFEIGGHSLKATSLVSRIHKEFNVEIPLREVFKMPTILEIAQYMKSAKESIYSFIQAIEEKEYYPASSAQKRLYIVNQLENRKTAYNMAGMMWIEGNIDVTRFEQAFKKLVERHEAFRTSFEMIDGELVQKIHKEVEFSVNYMECKKEDLEDIAEGFVMPFDLSKAPLLRVSLVKIEDDKHLMMVDMHHIISDGISMDIFVREFTSLYEGKELGNLRIQYKDYAVWQKEFYEQEIIKKQEEYWLKVFEEEAPILNMITDYIRPTLQSFEGSQMSIKIGTEYIERLDRMAKEKGVTRYMILLAAYTALLSKWTGQQDILVGSPIAGRPHGDLENIIGMFVNTLVMRNYPEGEKTFDEFLKEVKENALKAYENQDYPFEELVEKLQIKADMGRNPLFDTVFVLQNTDNEVLEVEGLKFAPYNTELNVSKFDLTLNAVESKDSIEFCFEYCTKLFKKETIQRFAQHFMNLLEKIMTYPEIKIKDIDLLTEEEKNMLLYEFNNIEAHYPKKKTINALFEEQVEKTPNNVAVVYKDEQLTYAELNEKSNRLARVLRDYNIGADCTAGIMIERSIEMIVGILAILKAGGAYLPIDPGYPLQRIKYMLKDSRVKLLLTKKDLEKEMDSEIKTLYLDDESLYQGEGANLEHINDEGSLAYIIYTSGSTGTPKGNLTKHSNIMGVVKNTNYIEITEQDTLLQLSNYAFDGSTFDIYGALINGAKLVLVDKETVLDIKELAGVIEKNGITVTFMTTALFNMLIDVNMECFKNIRKVLFGGERVSVAHVRKALDYMGSGRIIHVYGPTETTVYATYYFVDNIGKDVLTIPIGKPLSNTKLYVLDKDNRLQPVGVAGELCISGDGLSKGYLNRPELTNEKFVPNPFLTGQKMYRTGDLVRWLSDGNIEFLGRIDQQVKIRGFRIELGEIELQLLKHTSVREAVVMDRKDMGGNKYLSAYIVSDKKVMASELRDYLRKDMPDYMVPSYFMQLEKMPLTSNGKIDRKALPKPDGSINSGVEYVAPVGEVEEKLVLLWQEILGVEKVGTKDNFFDLGGHSLRATRLVSDIHKEFNVEMPLREVFMGPTIAQIAQYIKGAEKNIYGSVQPAKQKEYYPMSSAQKRLYILTQLEGADTSYNMAGGVIVEGSIDVIRLEEAFQKLIERHESLRTSFEMIDGQPVQKVSEKVDFHVEYIEAVEGKVEDIVKKFVKPFDLSKAPLLRITLVKLDNQHLLLFDMHHIISDGVSMSILLREFAELYEGKDLPELRIQYKDYAVWQSELFENGTIKKQQDYWLNTFAGEIPVLDMPLDYQRPSVQKFEGSSIDFEIDRLLVEKLDKLAKEKGATMYMVLLAAYTSLLSKYTGQEEIVVGSPIAGRPHSDLQDIIGMFVNTLAMRNYPKREKTFEKFLQEVKENALKAYENQDYPFEELVDKLNLKRDMSRNPLFDTMFTLQNADSGEREVKDLNFKPWRLEERVSKFDISLDAFEGKEGMLFTLEYCTRLFTKETMERIAKHFINILEVIAENPSVKISEIDMLSEKEKQQLVYDFNSNKAEFNRDFTVHHLFEEHAKKAPNDTAIIFEGEKYSYGQINEKANRIANYLVKAGLQREEPVAVLLDRSPRIVEGILGIWKAGGTYIPIDPDYPMQRIENVLEESKVRFILSLSEYASPELENAYDGQWICLDTLEEEIEKESGENLELDIDTNGLAYVIYTSGSTGRPKGAMIEHLGMMNHIHAEIDELKITKTSLVAQNASHCFDVSVWQFFAALTIGARIAIYPNEVVVDVRQFTDRIIEDGVTVLEVVPSVLVVMIEHMKEQGKRAEELKYLLVTGETVKADLIEKWFEISKETKVVNAYGPAEASDDVTQHTMTEVPKGESIPIGKPIQNISIYIVDQDMKLCPVGVKGEICVSGIGVGRGYLNNPEKTKEVFMEDPFIEEKGVRLYKTGDIGRWLENGNIEFYGRKDYQVKIRGHRIELEEIETRILKHPKVKEAVVVDKAEATGEKTLCGYIVFEGGTKAGELREYLQEYLPGYMIPTYIVPIEKMPLSSNGKVDRKALPEPDEDMRTGVEYVAPRDETEEKLAVLWQEILGVERVGINDNFFEIGGHSLKATNLVSRIHKEFNVEVPLAEVFKLKTLKALAECIKKAETSIYASIEPVEEKEYYMASSAQKRLYILSRFEDVGTGYNMPTAMIIEGSLDIKRLEDTFKALINRHETLRTSFGMLEDEVVQKVHHDWKFEVVYTENSHQSIDEMMKSFVRPFDLSEPPLLRVELVKQGENRHVLLMDIHHIISDGVSESILVEEFNRLYRGEELEVLPLQYRDYAHWQNNLLKSDVMKKQEDYWFKVFEEEIPVLNMPTDYQRPAMQSFEGESIIFEVDNELTERIKKLAVKEGATMFMVLLAAYNTMLSKYTGQEDIVVGTPIAGRPHADLRNIIGMFLNTLAIRNYPEGKKTFKEFLKEVKENALKAYENQDYQFEELVEKLDIRRDMSRNPLFDTVLVLQNTENNMLEAEGLKITPYSSELNIAKFDLTLRGIELEDKISFDLEYCTKLFKKETVESIAKHFIKVLKQITKHDEICLEDIDMLTQEERGKLLYDFNNTQAEYPRSKTIQELFEQQVEKVPDHVAVVSEDKQLTYRELNEKANQVARILRDKGVEQDKIVGIMINRSVEMIIGILGILKAGGAYLPIDPEYPEDRIQYMLEDSGTGILLTQKDAREKAIFEGDIILLDDERIYAGSSDNLEVINKPDSLAYIIYTSGTTGKPKGVMIEHKNVVGLMFNDKIQFDFNQNDIWTMFHSYSFDFSVWEMYGALLYGGKLIVVSRDTARDSREYLNLLKREQVTILNQTPSAFYRLVEEELSYKEAGLAVRYVIFGGEALQPAMLKGFKERYTSTKLINMYGITETTVHVTYKEITMEEIESNISNIGVPIPTLTTYVMDKNMKLLPLGIAGELCVGGDGVARGYLNRTELTAEKFVSNPYKENERLYRSGDLVRRLANGEMEYLGRIDRQVKIRGFRIELGEIQAVLRQHPAIKEAVVLARSQKSGEQLKRLVAYVVRQGDEKPSDSLLRQFLREQLPDYMIPSIFITIEAIPLTSNGKVNTGALPEPDGGRLNREENYVAPQTEREKLLAEIWANVLELDKVGIHDNFFDIGGDSILSIKIVAQAKARGYSVSVKQLFQYVTIHELAEQISEYRDLEVAVTAEDTTQAFGLLSAEDSAKLFKNSHKRGE
ncbi:non-ribosomal peptide synthase/polyketide synthase [Wukongibacter sp. M2B1]|uniref:non-ribosomal peptide synthase/polyketide synthase n=1 Tax=Wukongibacter sp. M2B1 TaxID=3088895 RepID=UPI003D7AFE2E